MKPHPLVRKLRKLTKNACPPYKWRPLMKEAADEIEQMHYDLYGDGLTAKEDDRYRKLVLKECTNTITKAEKAELERLQEKR